MEEFAATCPFPVVYVHEPERGISRARNAVLDACEDRFDWIAFTDDDCQPEPNWIASLLAAAERHDADVVYGRREWVPPDPVPFWYEPPEINRRTEGQALDYAATHNVLMAGELAGLRFDEGRRPGLKLLRVRGGLRFDVDLAHGEDTDFFHRATIYGVRIVYSAELVVHETIPPHRATLRYQTLRAFYYAASRSDFHRRYKGVEGAALKVLVRLVLQVPVAIVRLATAPLVWPFSERRFKRHVLKGLARLMGAAGALVGFAGFSGNPYG